MRERCPIPVTPEVIPIRGGYGAGMRHGWLVGFNRARRTPCATDNGGT